MRRGGVRDTGEKDYKKYDRILLARLLRYLAPYRIQVVFAILMLVGFSLLQLAGPYIVKQAIDGPLKNNDFQQLLSLTFLYLATVIGSFLCMFGQIYLMQWTGQHIMYDMRMKLFNHLQKLSLRFFDANPVGRLMTRLTSDIETLNELFASGVVQGIGDVLTLIGILVILFFLNIRLALASLSVLIFLAIVTMIFRIKFRESFRKVRARVAALNAFLQENIAGIHVIQLFNHQKKSWDDFESVNRFALDAYLKTIFYFALFVPFVELANALSIVLILTYGGFLIPSNAITIGVLVAFLQYAQRFFRPIRDLSEKYNILQAAMASSERVFAVLDNQSIISDDDHGNDLNQARGEIVFENVWFSYVENEWVLKDVSFTIRQGETIAIVGATGAGKSTIINLLCRFYDPQKGTIYFDGIDIRKLNKRELRKQLGLVHQDAFLFSGTVAENIRLGRDHFDLTRIDRLARDIEVHPFIERLPDGYNEQVGERGNRFSSGERQLLAFARAVSFEPKVLVLDEATSNIDTETEFLIQKATEKITRQRTAIVIAHRLSTISQADRIFVFHKARLREQGTHEQLLALQGIYARLYQLYFSSAN